jgi:hypothetical protein
MMPSGFIQHVLPGDKGLNNQHYNGKKGGFLPMKIF